MWVCHPGPAPQRVVQSAASFRVLVACACVLSAMMFASRPAFAQSQIQLADDAPLALSPEESRQLFRTPPGFHVELVASEPYLADPVAMAFDAKGRILVCEIHGYNLEGYFDVVELNKSGQLDKQVRRITASDKAIKQAEQGQYGTVKLLKDTNGDGRIDQARVWADHLPPCYGVVPARGGVIVLCAPKILYLADRDDDGRAEVRETLFTGFGTGELWTRINNPRWGLDNWIYAVSGADSRGTIRGPRLEREVVLGSVCFRFRADGTAIEAAGGRTHGFGQAMNDFGERFLCTNQQHAMHVISIAHQYLARNPYFAAPDLTRNISTYGHPARVYPTSKPDPWRRARAADPAWVRFYGEAEATANGYFTAASGQVIYRGGAFPEAFRGNHFSVDNAQNMIHRCLLETDGVSYLARRPEDDEQTEFLTSTEQWFRPVNLMNGPDGALYVVDMYRDIIEDYSAIPRYLQQLYVRSLIAGARHGRIWRIVSDAGDAAQATQRPFDLTKANATQLVRYLSDGNAWWRQTAQRLLVERQDRTAVPALLELLRAGATPQSRLHALNTLAGLGALTLPMLELALRDPHFAVRTQALQLADQQLSQHELLLQKMLTLRDDPHPRVRMQLALSLGESRTKQATRSLIELTVRHGDDPWMSAAVLSATRDTADEVLEAILAIERRPNHGEALLPALASIVGARRDAQQMGRTLTAIGRLSVRQAALRRECLSGLLEGLERGRAIPVGNDNITQGLRSLLADQDVQVRRLALRVAASLRLQQLPEMRALFAEASRVALDKDVPLPLRSQSVALLAAAPWETLRAVAEQLLDARQPIAIQLETVEAIGGIDHPEADVFLLAGFNRFTPKLQSAVIHTMFAREDRLSTLLEAIEDGRVPRAGMDATRRMRLLNHPRQEIAAKAQQLFSTSGATADRQEVLAQYEVALRMPRDIERGKKIFEQQCNKCHRLGDQGFEVGPDLLTAKTRADETLLLDVLDPSNQITVGYNQYTVITEDGRIFSGVLAAETATSITLREEEKKETVILRRDIDEMVASPLSMMPQDVEKEVTPQDLADLLGFLRQTLGSAQPETVVLFDDDAEFIQLLTEGDGHARLELADSHAGEASLAVSPPQRFSANIPGWEYQITETPEPGQFRYLRFAWKQPAGDGVMLELAASGNWPAATDSRQRYYSGRNTTGWHAVRVSDEIPAQWTVVTRDLWKDFGSFTLTGIAPTAMNGEALFDRIELLRSLEPTVINTEQR